MRSDAEIFLDSLGMLLSVVDESLRDWIRYHEGEQTDLINARCRLEDAIMLLAKAEKEAQE